MPRPSKYPQELRERAVSLVREHRQDYPSEYEAIRSIATKLGIATPETLRKWVRQAEVDAGVRSGTTTSGSEQAEGVEEGERGYLRNEADSGADIVLRCGCRSAAPIASCVRHDLGVLAARWTAGFRGCWWWFGAGSSPNAPVGAGAA